MGEVAKLCPPSAARRSWFPAAHSHQPSGAINQLGGISLICYRGEQPEKASAHRRPRKSGHGAASCGRRASARRPLCCSNDSFIFIHHPCTCQVHTDQKFAREICGFSSRWNKHLRTTCFAEPGKLSLKPRSVFQRHRGAVKIANIDPVAFVISTNRRVREGTLWCGAPLMIQISVVLSYACSSLLLISPG